MPDLFIPEGSDDLSGLRNFGYGGNISYDFSVRGLSYINLPQPDLIIQKWNRNGSMSFSQHRWNYEYT